MQMGRTCRSPEERQHRVVEGRCIYCGQVGHYIATCSLRNSPASKSFLETVGGGTAVSHSDAIWHPDRGALPGGVRFSMKAFTGGFREDGSSASANCSCTTGLKVMTNVPENAEGDNRSHAGTDRFALNGFTEDLPATDSFVQEAMAIIMDDVVRKAGDVRRKVCEWRSPEDLKELLDLALREEGEAPAETLQHCRDAIRYSIKTNHPHFFNQLYVGVDPYAMVGSFVTDATQPSQYTYEMAPVHSLIEDVVLGKMMELIGWVEGGDGIFNPGGSMSNMYAMNLARFQHCPDVKELGLSASPRLVLFTTKECHYSVAKAAAFLGIGTKNVYMVPTDKRGKMIPMALEKQIRAAKSEGAVPFMVSATAGTTVLGSFDPIEKIADICEQHNLWLHVDACWGGAALMSSKHKHLLKGIHRANSVAWNPHKMLMAGLQCCAFMVRDKTGLLKCCHSANASYLFQTDKFYDISYDTGDKSIQCGRKADAFRFWLMWKALGTRELEHRVDRALETAKYLTEEIKKREGFRLLMEPEYANVCFWYIPPSLRNIPDSPEFWQKVHAVAPKVKERMLKKGSMMICYQTHGGKANFFRMIVISPRVGAADMDFVLDEIHRLGADL
ncbi:Acidic amino acid decarboxylase GADL1 [Merluccius polli]|uniref:Acidic amino acid decarboxylase GADL1 n=1 Tax=Merluccius polli TaxID=89951 RepID=A0AA47MWV8_MERPO|nr:Acidic amino acid decarboxylase GADL1 [Merluccius polli]